MGANLILPAGSAAASGGGDSTPADPVVRSLRFNATDDLYKATGSTNTTWTVSMWVKRSKLSSLQYFFSWGGDGINFDANDKISIWNGASYATSTAVFRDVSSWYHLTISCNAGTITVYVNGVSQTMSSSPSYPAWGNVYFGRWSGNSYYKFDGYLADIYGIEGSALDHTSFTESNDYGGLKPKAYTGSFGTNGFHIDAQPAHDADLLVSSVGRNDGDTTFADAAKGHTITTNGDPEHSIAVGNPFTGTGKAIKFGTSNTDNLEIWDGSSGDYQLGTDDYTIECWFNLSSQCATSASNCYHTIFQGYDNINGHLFERGGVLYYYTGADASSYVYDVSITDVKINTWHHVAVVRSGNTISIYLDGSLNSSKTRSGGWTEPDSSASQPFRIGGGDHYYIDGYVYDFRVSSSARYTGSFTVPSSKFTDDTDTELIVQPESTDSGWVDLSHNTHGITQNGTVTRTASTPFDAAAKSTAMYFDGNDRVMANDSSDLNFGTGAFTLEFWYQHVSDVNGGQGGVNGDIVLSKGQWNTSTQGWMFFTHSYGSDGLFWSAYKVNGSAGTNYSLSANSDGVALAHDGDWHHIAVTRDGSGNMGLFIDGTRYGDETGYGGNVDNSSYGLRMGAGYGYSGSESNYANCYLYDVRVTKGEAKYDPTSSSVTKPSAPLELNPVYLGGDQSGNKNHFTPTGISITHDVILDTPTKNYATINVLHPTGAVTAPVSEGNLKIYANTYSGGNYEKIPATIPIPTSGKWYVEFYAYTAKGSGNISSVGVIRQQDGTWDSSSGHHYELTTGNGFDGITPNIYGNNMTLRSDGAVVDTDSGGTLNNSAYICALAIDVDNGKIYGGYESGGAMTWMNSGDPTSGSTGTGAVSRTFSSDDLLAIEVVVSSAGTNGSGFVMNFGQDPTFAGEKTSGQDTSQSEFYYAPPTGFKSLNTSNLDDPTVTPSENFEIAQWVGNETAGKVISTDISPDLVWIKNRDVAKNHTVGDSVRGANKALFTNNTNVESTATTNITAFDTDASGGYSFTLGASEKVNDNTKNHVGWVWKAHQSPSTGARTSYTVKVEDASEDGWDANTSFIDGSNFPTLYMELFENRTSGLASLGKVAVRSLDDDGNSTSDQSEQTYTLKCVDLDAIAVKWYYDTSGDNDESDYPNSYNDFLNDQKITILDGSTSEWTINNHSNDDGATDYNYSPPTGWANGDTLKSATTSYTGSDQATLISGAGPVEKYNAAAGFSIISYTGNKSADGNADGETQEITHSLGAEPELIITKSRGSGNYDEGKWEVYHKHTVMDSSHTDNGIHPHLWLNESYDAYQGSYNPAIPKSGSANTIIEVTNDNGYGHYANENGLEYIMYAWTPVEGYSKFGKYTGNGSTDGPFVYTGFRPAFVMIKNTVNSSVHWNIHDSARDPHNLTENRLSPNNNNAEDTGWDEFDFLSTGFKAKAADTGNNGNGDTIIYAAFAESPLKYSNAK